MIVIIDGHRRRVVVTQHGLGDDSGIRRGGADFRTSKDTWVAEVDVEVLILLEDVIVDHAHGNLCESTSEVLAAVLLRCFPQHALRYLSPSRRA